MKKLAIIGTSNSIIRNGYGMLAARKLPGECDVFGLGANSSLFALFSLLQERIVNEYQYVVLDFNINETFFINASALNKETTIAYWACIFKQFMNSASRPIILLLPLLPMTCYGTILASQSYVIRAMAKIFNVYLIDFENAFNNIDKSILGNGPFHYKEFFQDFICNTILTNLQNGVPVNTVDIGSISVSLLPCSAYSHLKKVDCGTSLMKKQTFQLSSSDKLLLPEDQYLCAVFYWVQTQVPFLIYQNDALTLYKNLNFYGDKLFLCRSIGWSVSSGLKGGALSCSWLRPNGIMERSAQQNDRYPNVTPPPPPKKNIVAPEASIFINAILLCNQPLPSYGEWFYFRHLSEFTEARKEIARLFHDQATYNDLFVKLDSLAQGAGELFRKVLPRRPDLAKLLKDRKDGADKLVIWALFHGRHEVASLGEATEILNRAMKTLVTVADKGGNMPGFSRLCHVLGLMGQL